MRAFEGRVFIRQKRASPRVPSEPAPSFSSSMHSNVTSNWNGFRNGEGLSRTATFASWTLAMARPTNLHEVSISDQNSMSIQRTLRRRFRCISSIIGSVNVYMHVPRSYLRCRIRVSADKQLHRSRIGRFGGKTASRSNRFRWRCRAIARRLTVVETRAPGGRQGTRSTGRNGWREIRARIYWATSAGERLHSRETHVVYRALRSFEGPLKRASRPLWSCSTTIEKELISRSQNLEGIFVKGDTFISANLESRGGLWQAISASKRNSLVTHVTRCNWQRPMKSTDA